MHYNIHKYTQTNKPTNTEEIDKLIFGVSTPQKATGGSSIELDGDTIPFWDLPKQLRAPSWKEDDIEAVNTGGANLAARRKSNYD